MSSSNPHPSDDADVEQAIIEVERYLNELKQRYVQIERDRSLQLQLQERQQELKSQQRQEDTQVLRAELRQIQQRLEALEVNLESRLLDWSSFKEPFWQALRFGGLGVVLGWILKSCAG